MMTTDKRQKTYLQASVTLHQKKKKVSGRRKKDTFRNVM